jgi:hypothetical protein
MWNIKYNILFMLLLLLVLTQMNNQTQLQRKTNAILFSFYNNRVHLPPHHKFTLNKEGQDL